MLPPEARTKLKGWIRSRHLIYSGSFCLFQTINYKTIERFEACLKCLGGTVIYVRPLRKIWLGNHRQVVLYEIKASLFTQQNQLKQYWAKYGGFYHRFDERG